MAHTDNDTVVAEAITTLIEDNLALLQLNAVYYGNHNNIPVAAGAVVTPGGHRRTLAGVSGPGGRTENSLMVDVAIHYSKVGDEATERRAVDALGYTLEKLLHVDTTLGGIVIHGFVQQTERGETIMANNSMFRSVRLLYVATTKTYLSPPAAPV